MTADDDMTPNLPLLRKAVDWAEEQAQLPRYHPQREWHQDDWYTSADERKVIYPYTEAEISECGSSYCIFGYVCYVSGEDMVRLAKKKKFSERGRDLLGLTDQQARSLSSGHNDIERVRAIAIGIARDAGETL